MKYVQPEIENKNIRSIYELSASFDLFAREGAGIDGDMLWKKIVEAILTRHGEAKASLPSSHSRPIWKQDIDGFYFYYQVLSKVIEVGPIVSAQSHFAFEPTQDLLAEFTDEEAV